EERIKFTKGTHAFTISFNNNFKDEKASDPALRDRNLYIYYLEFEGKFDAERPALPDSHKKIMIAEPTGGKKAEAAKKIIQNFANRAFRRIATDAEVHHLMKLWESADKVGEPFERS